MNLEQLDRLEALPELGARTVTIHRTEFNELIAAARLAQQTVHYERAPALDRRIDHGDDFAGDAWVRWVAVGHSPDAPQEGTK